MKASTIPDVKNSLGYMCPTSGNQFSSPGPCPQCGAALKPIREIASAVHPRASVAGDPGALASSLPGAPTDAPDKFAGERAEAEQLFQASSPVLPTAKTLSGNSLPLESLAKVSDEGENGWNQQQINDIARTMQRIAAGANHYPEPELVGAVIRAERGELRR